MLNQEQLTTALANEQPQNDATEKALARAIGDELRAAREALGWSRGQLVSHLPSGIGDRTLLSYEHGTRHLTVVRLLELCRPLGVAGPTLLTQALQRAQLELSNVVMRIDLRFLLKDGNDKFRPMGQWARNKLKEHPDGVVEVPPPVVKELASFAGYTHPELASYLARFMPENNDYGDSAKAGGGTERG